MGKAYFLSERDVFKIRNFLNQRNVQIPGRRRRGKRGGTITTTTTGGGDVLIVLIDEDIEGVVEDTDAELTAVGTAGTADDVDLQYPLDNSIDTLNLVCYERRTTSLKYYKKATSVDPGYEEGKEKMILATVEVAGTGTGTGDWPPVVTYDTQDVFYDDGKDFIVGEYTRSDYPDYPEDEVFPPDGEGTYNIAPDGFFNKRYRGIAVKDADDNWVLVTALCQVVPAPSLVNLLIGT